MQEKPGRIQPPLRLYAKLPLDRIGVLIGDNGRVKQEIMNKTQTHITVDSDAGMVIIEPRDVSGSPYMAVKAQEIVNAIAYGFPPDKAMKLLDEDYVLITIDLKQYVGNAPNHLYRVKARIIGEKGRVKKTIEEMTGTSISVYKTFVSIIGEFEAANVAKHAIEMLIDGRQHSTVYRYIERSMFSIRRDRMLQLWRRTV